MKMLKSNTNQQIVSALEFTPLTGDQSGDVKAAPNESSEVISSQKTSLYVYLSVSASIQMKSAG